MAARSAGIFPREGFNLDNAFPIFQGIQTTAPVNLLNVRSFRVVFTGIVFTQPVGDGDPAFFDYALGNKTFLVGETDVVNGTYIAHHRGFSLSQNTTQFNLLNGANNTGTGGTVAVEFAGIELVDGPAR